MIFFSSSCQAQHHFFQSRPGTGFPFIKDHEVSRSVDLHTGQVVAVPPYTVGRSLPAWRFASYPLASFLWSQAREARGLRSSDGRIVRRNLGAAGAGRRDGVARVRVGLVRALRCVCVSVLCMFVLLACVVWLPRALRCVLSCSRHCVCACMRASQPQSQKSTVHAPLYRLECVIYV